MEKELTTSKAIEIAQTMESVAKDVTSISPVNRVETQQPSATSTYACHRCGGTRHSVASL